MTLFIDASAVVAMLAQEPDALDLSDRLDHSGDLLWSPIVQWEAVAALSRIRGFDPYGARSDVNGLSHEWQFKLVPIGERESALAFQAFVDYGKQSGHPAKLNMGDCFAYACAKANNARLLYKGDDFAKTDLA